MECQNTKQAAVLASTWNGRPLPRRLDEMDNPSRV
jgi:hypothetical protein